MSPQEPPNVSTWLEPLGEDARELRHGAAVEFDRLAIVGVQPTADGVQSHRNFTQRLDEDGRSVRGSIATDVTTALVESHECCHG